MRIYIYTYIYTYIYIHISTYFSCSTSHPNVRKTSSRGRTKRISETNIRIKPIENSLFFNIKLHAIVAHQIRTKESGKSTSRKCQLVMQASEFLM